MATRKPRQAKTPGQAKPKKPRQAKPSKDEDAGGVRKQILHSITCSNLEVEHWYCRGREGLVVSTRNQKPNIDVAVWLDKDLRRMVDEGSFRLLPQKRRTRYTKVDPKSVIDYLHEHGRCSRDYAPWLDELPTPPAWYIRPSEPEQARPQTYFLTPLEGARGRRKK